MCPEFFVIQHLSIFCLILLCFDSRHLRFFYLQVYLWNNKIFHIASVVPTYRLSYILQHVLFFLVYGPDSNYYLYKKRDRKVPFISCAIKDCDFLSICDKYLKLHEPGARATNLFCLSLLFEICRSSKKCVTYQSMYFLFQFQVVVPHRFSRF